MVFGLSRISYIWMQDFLCIPIEKSCITKSYSLKLFYLHFVISPTQVDLHQLPWVHRLKSFGGFDPRRKLSKSADDACFWAVETEDNEMRTDGSFSFLKCWLATDIFNSDQLGRIVEKRERCAGRFLDTFHNMILGLIMQWIVNINHTLRYQTCFLSIKLFLI